MCIAIWSVNAELLRILFENVLLFMCARGIPTTKSLEIFFRRNGLLGPMTRAIFSLTWSMTFEPNKTGQANILN